MSDFSNIKEGDKVVLHLRSGAIVAPVSHTTPTTFVARDMIFYKKNGKRKGGSAWDYVFATIESDETVSLILELQAKANLRNKIKGLFPEIDCSLEDLKKIYSILNKYVVEL